MRHSRESHWVPVRALTWLCLTGLVLVGANSERVTAQDTGDSTSYRLSHTDPATVVPQLRDMLREYGAEAELLIEKSQNRIIVRGAAPARQLAGQFIQALDKSPAPPVAAGAGSGPGQVVGYPVATDRLDAVADLLRQRFPVSSGVRIAPDRRTSQLVVIASAEAHTQISDYLGQIGAGPVQGAAQPGPGLLPGGAAAYQLQHVSAVELESSLQRLWGNQLIITPDARGTAASVRRATDPVDRVLMRVDRARRTVEFPVSDDVARSWRQVVAALDRPGHGADATTQLVPVRRADPAQVQQAVSMIRDAALRTDPGETMAAVPIAPAARSRGGVNLVSMIFRPEAAAQESAPGAPPPAPTPPAETPPAPAPQGPPGEAADGDEAEGLLGDVQIEFVPELGVIILRGNRRDVERVQRIINEIEAQSEITRPEIEVALLQHTNSEAMSTLVTQVYTDVYQPRQGSLSITPLVKPNAILLVGRQENIDTVLTLIEKLDQPVAPETQISVFRLLHMSAVNAETYIRNFYGTVTGAAVGAAQQTQQTVRGLSPRVTVIADYRSNSLIVQASPRDLEEVSKLLKELDVDKTEATVEVRVFPLRNSLASTLQGVLQNTLAAQAQAAAGAQTGFQPIPTGQTGAATQTQPSRSVQIIGIDQQGNKIIETALLSDITVTADDNSNTLVVKAPSQSMGLIAALVEQLDKIPAAESQIKVFQIKNGDATNLTSMLQTLFGQQVTAGQVGVFSQTVGRTFGAQTALQQTSAGESSLIPLNFGVDARTNSIVAAGSAGDLAVVEAILLRLDEGDLRQRKLIVYRLNNAPAQFVADALTQILNEQYQLLSQQQTQQFSLISQFELIDQQVSVVPETISNTLVVSATPKYFEQITEVIQDLDRRPPMIMIQVVVCLVRLDETEELGVELGIQDSLLFDRSATAAATATSAAALIPGFNFAGAALGNSSSAASLATRDSLAGQAVGTFGLGRTSATEGFPGLVLSGASDSINILIRALARKSRVEVLSRPQIMTLNNVPASVLVGQRIPQITDFQTTSAGNTVNSITLIDVGISLGVIPRVTPDGLIIMDIEANDSKAGDPAEGVTVGVQDGVAIQSPIYDDITAITTIAARSGQTVVFGGLITTERVDTFRGIPFLSDVPVLGHLFRYDTQSDKRQELLFFMTPHIVMDDQDVDMVNQRESERMSWCLADVMQIHGDPGFRGGHPDAWTDGTPLIYPSVDPTASGAVMPLDAEPVPAPTGEMLRKYGAPADQGKPFLLPPDAREEGKPFILPPAERQEGRPFIEPMGPAPGGTIPLENSGVSAPQNVPPPAGNGPGPSVSAADSPPPGPYPLPPTPWQVWGAPAAVARASESVTDEPPRTPPLAPPAPSVPGTSPARYVPRPQAQFPYVK